MKSLMTFVLTAASSMFALTTYAQNCPARLAPGSIIPDPPMVYAKDGAIGGTLYAYYDGDPAVGRSGRYCLMYSGDPAQPPIEAPVFRVAPGDRLNFSLANRMPDTPPMEAYDWNEDVYRVPASLVVLVRHQLCGSTPDLYAEYLLRERKKNVAIAVSRLMKPDERLSINKLKLLAGIPRTTAARWLSDPYFQRWLDFGRKQPWKRLLKTNRRRANNSLQLAVARAERINEPVSLILCDLDHFGDLRALLTLADPDLDAGALGHAAVPRGLQLPDVHECFGPAGHGDKPKALLGIEPFDDCFDRLRCLRRARPWIARPPFGYSILGDVIVIVTAALGLTVVFVAAHSTSIRIATITKCLVLSAD